MHLRRLVVAVFALALVASACGKSKSADPPASTSASSVVDEEDEEYVAPEYEELIELTIEDLQFFWGETYPDLYGERYESIPPDRLFAGSPSDPPPACGDGPPSYENVEENAFYCILGDFVAWDDVGLFPRLYEESGAYSVSLVLAHEWGHAIQGRQGLIGSGIPTIVTELQADCFAGVWTKRLAEGGNARLEFDPTALEQALSGMISFGDRPGNDPTAQGAHGSGFDRVNAFQEGFDEGGERCVEFVETNASGQFVSLPEIFEFTFTSDVEALSGGNLALPVLIDSIIVELNDYMSTILDFEEVDAVESFDSSEGEEPCDGPYQPEDPDNDVFYCADDNTVYYDNQLFVTINREIGDYGVGVLLTMEWVRAAQHQADFDIENFDTVRQRACLAGAFSRAMAERAINGYEGEGLVLSPGDLDEAVQAFLLVPPSDVEDFGGVFELVTAFRDGVFNGPEPCEAYV